MPDSLCLMTYAFRPKPASYGRRLMAYGLWQEFDKPVDKFVPYALSANQKLLY